MAMSRTYRDGHAILEARLTELRAEREALLERRRDVEGAIARLDAEADQIQARLPFPPTDATARPPRWWPLLLLGVPASAGAWAVVWLIQPICVRPKMESAAVGAGVIRRAAEIHMATEDAVCCPTLDDLVAANDLDGLKGDDPWGRPYRVECSEGEVRVWSSGKDRRARTADDIADDYLPSDLKRVAELD